MNELKPKVQLRAPASLKRNVMEQIDKEKPQKRRIAVWRWYAAAAIVAIGIMTFALWPHSTVKQHVAVKGTPVSSQPKEVSMSIAKTVPKTVPMADSDMKKHKILSKRKVLNPSYTQPYVPKTIKEEDEKPALESEDEILVVGFGKALPVAGAIQQVKEDPISNPIDMQEYTPEEQRLIDQVNKHRDIVYARLADELEQASFKQRQLQQLTYNNWLQMRQILLRICTNEEAEKTDKPIQTI